MPRPITLAWVGLCALAVRLVVGAGFANYDTAYALAWGAGLADGRLPDYSVPVSPTPHPLATFAGLLLSPLGDGAETAAVVLAFLALGGLGVVAYKLGAHAFGPAAGALAALVVLTREPVLSFGVRTYVDIPYVVLVLCALLAELRHPRSGRRVLILLAVAGLLRPEAWLFAGAYVLYLAVGRPDRRELVPLALLAGLAPALWLLADLLVTGNPLQSLTGTRETAQALGRATGLDDLLPVAPRRLGEILREPVLVGAAGGGLLTLGLLRPRARLLAAAGALAVVAFCALAAAGLPIIGRYLLLPAVLLSVFCGAGVFGWRVLDRSHRWRRAWTLFGAAVALGLVALAPAQLDRIGDLRRTIAAQREIRDDLHAFTRAGRFRAGCRPVAVPNHRPVPLLALWLGRAPGEIVSAALRRPDRGYYVEPATRRVRRLFILDPRDPRAPAAAVPPGFRATAVNASWRLLERCPPG